MKLKIKPSDADAPEKELDPADGEEVPVNAGDTVEFPEGAPVAGVPVGNDLYLFFADGTSVILKGFFDYGEGTPPVLDLGEGNSFVADYSFQAEDGPIGFLFGDNAPFSLTGYEAFSLSAIGTSGLGSGLIGEIAKLAGISPVNLGEGPDGGDLVTGLESDIGMVLPKPPLVCVEGVPIFGTGAGNLGLTHCDDFFVITSTATKGNKVRALEGNDTVSLVGVSDPDHDVQDNFMVGGPGNDGFELVSVGEGNDNERNTLLGDGADGAGDAGAGMDTLNLFATGVEGDAGFNFLSGGGGADVLNIAAFKDVEFNTLKGGEAGDFIYGYAGRVFTGSELGSAIGLDFGGDGFSFGRIISGIRFNAIDLPGDVDEDGDPVPVRDNIAWLDSPADGVLVLDRNDDGLITELNEIDFSAPDSVLNDSLLAPAGGLPVFMGAGETPGREVVVGLDLGQDGTIDFEFRTIVDGAGDWSVDTATAVPTLPEGGTFDPLTEGEAFDVTTTIQVEGALTSYQALAAYDSNSDGVFSSDDAEFGDFMVWRDLDGDGMASAGELQGLTAAGITGIDLARFGVSFTVVATAGGATVVTTESASAEGGDVVLTGVVGPPSSLVTILIDQDLNGFADVSYEVTSDASSMWTLDTATAIPTEGIFTPFPPLELALNDVIVKGTGSFGFDDGTGLDVTLTGVVATPDAVVMVGLDTDQEGTANVEYEVLSDAAGAWSLDTATAVPVSGELGILTALQFFDVIVTAPAEAPIVSTAQVALPVRTAADFSFLGGAGGEESGREDFQKNSLEGGAGNDSITAIAHQDVQDNTVKGGEGDDFAINLFSIIDDLFFNEVFGDGGNDSILLRAFENNYDNAVLGGFGADSIALEGDRILDNVVLGGDDEGEVLFRVTTDEFGNWTLDTATATPVSGTFALIGARFDLSVTVDGVTEVTTREAGIMGGDVMLSGIVGTPGSVVTIGLDLDRNGTNDVTYEVISDPGGAWAVDTATAVPLSGTFVPFGGARFDVDTSLEGVPVTFTEVAGETVVTIQMSAGDGSDAGKPVVTGVSSLPGTTVEVSIDLGQNGSVDFVYEVESDGAGAWTIDTATAVPVSGTPPFPELSPGEAFDVSALSAANPTGDLMLAGTVDLPHAKVIVALDLDRDGTADVEFQVTSDAAGGWTLDTETDLVISGTFVATVPGQSFDVSATASATDNFIENEIGVAGGGTDVSTEFQDVLDIGTVNTTTGDGNPVISGTAPAGTIVTVGFDLAGDGDEADLIRLTASGEANSNEINGHDGNDQITVEVTGADFTRPLVDPGRLVPFVGGAHTNDIRGSAGNDTISVLVAGEEIGADRNIYRANGNTLTGGVGGDSLSITVSGEEGDAINNFLDGGAGADGLIVTLEGKGAIASNNTLDGGAGGDGLLIRAEPGASVAGDSLMSVRDNSLIGGDGPNDLLISGLGLQNAERNTLVGGADDDIMGIESTNADAGDISAAGLLQNNLLEGHGGSDDITISSEGSLPFFNTVRGGDGDDTVSIGGGPFLDAQFVLNYNTLDGGAHVDGDTLRILDEGDITGNGGATNFEAFDMTNGVTNVNTVTVSLGFFDGLTGTPSGGELKILGDPTADSVNLDSLWYNRMETFEENGVIYNVFTDTPALVAGTRTLHIQSDLAFVGQLILPPVVLDLGGDGFAFSAMGEGMVFDLDGDGRLEELAWASPGDAVLAFDRDGDGMITDRAEFAFADYLEGAETDLEGLKFFDTNANGMLDQGDEAFESFYLWQESNFDAMGSGAELTGLADYGIQSIALETREGSGFTDGDAVVFGLGEFTMEDGSVGTLADAGFLFRGSDRTLNFDGVDAGLGGDGSDGAGELGLLAEDVLDVAGKEYAGALAAIDFSGDLDSSPVIPVIRGAWVGAAGVGFGNNGNAEAGIDPWEGNAALVEGEVPPDDGIALA